MNVAEMRLEAKERRYEKYSQKGRHARLDKPPAADGPGVQQQKGVPRPLSLKWL
jgi:hypothetical protein